MSHLDDDVDTSQLSVADLLKLLQDVDVTMNKQPARVSEVQTDVSVGTQLRTDISEETVDTHPGTNVSDDTARHDNRQSNRQSINPHQDDHSSNRHSLDPMDGS